MKTHYDPFSSSYDYEEYAEKALCGTSVGENYESTNDERYVTCKRCLKVLPEINKYVEEVNSHRSEQEGAFVDFILNNK